MVPGIKDHNWAPFGVHPEYTASLYRYAQTVAMLKHIYPFYTQYAHIYLYAFFASRLMLRE